MMTVILYNQDRVELERTEKESNQTYLIKDDGDPQYPHLSELCDCAYDVLDASDMQSLTKELISVKKELLIPEQIEHVDEIICLAKRCQDENLLLVFTPFGAFSDNSIKTHVLKKPNAAEAEKSE
ncbi:MAG: hypothetical protein WKF84_14295 [Pyrinomonadaceae bacterium]